MVGNTYLFLRNIHGLSSKNLALKLDISQSYISELENGKKTPSMKTLDKYIKYFGLTLPLFLCFRRLSEGW